MHVQPLILSNNPALTFPLIPLENIETDGVDDNLLRDWEAVTSWVDLQKKLTRPHICNIRNQAAVRLFMPQPDMGRLSRDLEPIRKPPW